MLRETETKQGRVLGIPAADPRITAFKGIPFAAPPVGGLRWRAPQQPVPWTGVRDCSRFAPISMQETPGADSDAFYSKEWHVDPDIPMSEDCLYLNVWTPAKSTEERLPVMIWIFGGGMACGYPAEMEFDGERLARRNVVLVSVNYRVNGFGFLAHPELTEEAKARGEVPCNFGLMDQRAAICWVKENISAFGGDPSNITIFGQSAGGRSTWAHLASPMDNGLFQRAIVQSGCLSGDFARYPSLHKAEQAGKAFLEQLDVGSIAEARKLDSATVLAKALAFEGLRWGPALDGHFLVRDPVDSIQQGRQNDVTLMCGNTADEGFRWGDTLEEFNAGVRLRWGADSDEFMRLAQIRTEADVQRFYRSSAFNVFEIGNHLAARCFARQGRPDVYLYRFDPDIPGDDAGSFHSSDLWFVFETLAKCWRPFTGMHYDLARRMCNYWTNFARTGNPNGPDADGTSMPRWESAGTQGDRLMFLGNECSMISTAEDSLLQYEIKRCE